MSAPQSKVEVTRGVFDPRTYKEVDKDNWARKRRSVLTLSVGSDAMGSVSDLSDFTYKQTKPLEILTHIYSYTL